MMTAQQLKNSILQRAIEGKLVEQRSEEGTAKELLKEIKLEKEKLVKEGKIKKHKPLPDITEEEIPFEIPDSWEWCRLGNIGGLERGSGLKRSEVIAEGKPCIRYGELYTTYNTRFSQAVSCTSIDVFDSCHKVHFGDILMSLTGENKQDIAMALTYEGKEELAMGGDMTKWFAHGMNPLYLTYVLNSPYGISCKQSLATGNIIIHISNDKLGSIILPIPPLSEQHRIVAKIEELLSLVDQYDKAYSQLTALNEKFPQDMKKSILQYAIEGKLVEQRPEEGTARDLLKEIKLEKEKLIKEGKIKKSKPLPVITENEIPFEIPDSWEWVRLGDIGLTNIGLTYKPTDVIHENGTAVLRSNNIQDGKIVYDDMVYVKMTVPLNKMCNTDDILICARNGSKRLVGKAAVIENEGMSFGAFMAIFKPLSLDSYYVLSVINSAYFRNTLLNDTGTTTINQITQTMLKNFLFPLPPLSEQRRIVERLEQIIPLCNNITM